MMDGLTLAVPRLPTRRVCVPLPRRSTRSLLLEMLSLRRLLCCRRRLSWESFSRHLEEFRALTLLEMEDHDLYHHPGVLRQILVDMANHVPSAIRQWREWVAWREQFAVDCTEEAVHQEISSEVACWRGRDKQGRRCLVVIGRNHSPTRRKIKSFKKFLVYIVEKGCLFDGMLDSSDKEHEVCVLYDRRGLTNSHTDPDLVQICQETIGILRRFYGKRLGVVYILHVNFVFWLLYLILRPVLFILNMHTKFIIVNDSKGMPSMSLLCLMY